MKYFKYGLTNEIKQEAFAQRVLISSCNFTQNLSGQRSSAIDVHNIYIGRVEVVDSVFTNNTGALSIFEWEY